MVLSLSSHSLQVNYCAKSDNVQEDKMSSIYWQVVIVDESHYMKSRKSATTKFLVPMLQRAQRKILLTGTPALNRPEEVIYSVVFVSYIDSVARNTCS